MFEKIEIEYRHHDSKNVVIDMTKDAEKVTATITDLFQEMIGDKFGESQTQAFIDKHSESIGKLLNCRLQTGMLAFQRVIFDDGSNVMPSFKIEKV